MNIDTDSALRFVSVVLCIFLAFGNGYIAGRADEKAKHTGKGKITIIEEP